MRVLNILPLILATILTAKNSSAAEATWPTKGDTVHISATLQSVNPVTMLVFGVSPMESEVPACVPLRVTKAKPKRDLWIMKDPVNNSQRLEGPWLTRMHKTEATCRTHLSETGEPTIVRSGWIHKIVLRKPAQESQEQ